MARNPDTKFNKVLISTQAQKRIGLVTLTTGAGLDDIAITGLNYSVFEDVAFTITVNTEATPDTFDWSTSPDIGSGSGVSMDTAEIVLAGGIRVAWAANTGHTAADVWTFTLYAFKTSSPMPLDMCRIVDTTFFDVDPVNESTDVGRATGVPGPTKMTVPGHIGGAAMNNPETDYEWLARRVRDAEGSAVQSTIAAGVYQHVIVPSQEPEPPLACAGSRAGKNVQAKRAYGVASGSLSMEITKDVGAKMNLSENLVWSGKYDQDPTWSDAIAGTKASITLTVANGDIYGSTEAERLNSIHKVLCDLDGDGYYEIYIEPTGSDAVDSVQFDAPSTGGDAVNYMVLYRRDALYDSTLTPVPWGYEIENTEEPTIYPILATHLAVWVGGVLTEADGTYTYTGGRRVRCDLNSIAYNLDNDLQPKDCDDQTGDHADLIRYGTPSRTLNFAKDFTDAIMDIIAQNAEETSFKIQMLGPQIGTTGYYRTVTIYINKCQTPKMAKGDNAGRIGESGDFTLFWDPSNSNADLIYPIIWIFQTALSMPDLV